MAVLNHTPGRSFSWAQVIQICPLVADHPSLFHCYHLVAAGAHLKPESHPDFHENLESDLSEGHFLILPSSFLTKPCGNVSVHSVHKCVFMFYAAGPKWVKKPNSYRPLKWQVLKIIAKLFAGQGLNSSIIQKTSTFTLSVILPVAILFDTRNLNISGFPLSWIISL